MTAPARRDSSAVAWRSISIQRDVTSSTPFPSAPGSVRPAHRACAPRSAAPSPAPDPDRARSRRRSRSRRQSRRGRPRVAAADAAADADADADEAAGTPELGPSLREQVEAFERGVLARALAATGGNQSEAARRLGTSRVTLIDKLRKYGLTGPGATAAPPLRGARKPD